MKLVLILLIGCYTLAGWSKDVKNFNQVLIEDVQKDIQKDNEKFKETRPVSRGPASVAPIQVEPETEIEKLKQVGSPKW